MSELDTLFVILYSIFDNIFFIIALAAILKNAIFKNVPVIFQRFIGAKFHLHWSYLPNPLINLGSERMVTKPKLTFIFNIGLTTALSIRFLSVGLGIASSSFVIFLSATILSVVYE